jgi:hypothetical protein
MTQMLRLDDSHIVSHIVFESKPDVYHVDLLSISDDLEFPDMIDTSYGNEQPFKLYKKMYSKADNMHIATYKQPDSKAVLLVYVG